MIKLSEFYKQLPLNKNIPVKGVAHIKRKLTVALWGPEDTDVTNGDGRGVSRDRGASKTNAFFRQKVSLSNEVENKA